MVGDQSVSVEVDRHLRDGGTYGCAVHRAYAKLNPGLVRQLSYRLQFKRYSRAHQLGSPIVKAKLDSTCLNKRRRMQAYRRCVTQSGMQASDIFRERCDRHEGAINAAPPDRCKFADSKRRSLLMAGKDDEMFMTRSLNVTPKKTTEQHLVICNDKSVAYETNNKRLCSTFECKLNWQNFAYFSNKERPNRA